jgi:hypothetical protein
LNLCVKQNHTIKLEHDKESRYKHTKIVVTQIWHTTWERTVLQFTIGESLQEIQNSYKKLVSRIQQEQTLLYTLFLNLIDNHTRKQEKNLDNSSEESSLEFSNLYPKLSI